MKERDPLSILLPRTPFGHLVRHFVRRMFATEDETSSGSMSLGLGAGLAVLASPGAFASIFLLDKYSTLLQWLRGQNGFNPYRASIGDEYFFVVLSMTITGLVMVLRWNRLFPDRRDFWNLTALPIPIRNVFLANFTALLGLALLFGLDVNAVSCLFFPMIVTLSDGSVAAFLRIFVAHAAAVFSASLFSFFAVFALVGMLMLLLPAGLLRAVSTAVRILLVVGLLIEFLSNLFLQLMSGRVPHAGDYARILPSFWFLGIYGRAAGMAMPGMALLARRAETALVASILLAVLAYLLCYRRHFLRLAESFDSLSSVIHKSRVRIPAWLSRVVFRSTFERACCNFMLKVLLRSERHVMFVGAYWGVGLVMIAQTATQSVSQPITDGLPSADLLAIPLLLAFFLISGLRFVFDLPAALEANWLFRVAATDLQPPPRRVAQRFVYYAVLPWQIAILGAIAAAQFGWIIAIEATAMSTVISALSIRLVFMSFRKIAFTCSLTTDAMKTILRILGSLLTVMLAVPALAAVEHWALEKVWNLLVVAGILAAIWRAIRHQEFESQTSESTVPFDEPPAAAFELLKLV